MTEHCEHLDYTPTEYTNGELRALVGPVFGLNHDNIADVVITVVTRNGWVIGQSMTDPDLSFQDRAIKDLTILNMGMQSILTNLRNHDE